MSKISNHYERIREAAKIEFPLTAPDIVVPRHATLLEWVRLALIGLGGNKLVEGSGKNAMYAGKFRLPDSPLDKVTSDIARHLGVHGAIIAPVYATAFVTNWVNRKSTANFFDLTSIFEKAGPYRGVLAKLLAQRMLLQICEINDAFVNDGVETLREPLYSIAKDIMFSRQGHCRG
jgi:hypothetical protein